MTTITVKKGTKKDVNLLVDIAKKLGIEVTVSENKPQSKAKEIRELAKKINTAATKRMLETHGLL